MTSTTQTTADGDAGEIVERWRPEVIAFADLMEQQLRANDHKPGWKDDAAEDLVKRVEQEAGELREAVSKMRRIVWVPHDGRTGGWMRLNPDTNAPEMGAGYENVPEPRFSELAALAAREAADVANMAMMVADVCGALPPFARLSQAQPPATPAPEVEQGERWEKGSCLCDVGPLENEVVFDRNLVARCPRCSCALGGNLVPDYATPPQSDAPSAEREAKAYAQQVARADQQAEWAIREAERAAALEGHLAVARDVLLGTSRRLEEYGKGHHEIDDTISRIDTALSSRGPGE